MKKRCIICEKELDELYPDINIGGTLVNGGIIEQIIGSFGSKFDGMMLEITICDECLQERIDKKII